MTHGFQQQDPGLNFSFPKSAPTPQHGGKADRKGVALLAACGKSATPLAHP
jgi:hypothetical protein